MSGLDNSQPVTDEASLHAEVLPHEHKAEHATADASATHVDTESVAGKVVLPSE